MAISFDIQKEKRKTPTHLQVRCVCGKINRVPTSFPEMCECGVLLSIEPYCYNELQDILYIRPVAQLPLGFGKTVLPGTPNFISAEWYSIQ